VEVVEQNFLDQTVVVGYLQVDGDKLVGDALFAVEEEAR
jgi:hypothetical protein